VYLWDPRPVAVSAAGRETEVTSEACATARKAAEAMIARSSDAEVGDEERAMVYDVGEEGGAGAGAGVLGERGVRVGRGRVVTRRNERTRFYTCDCRARALSANHLPRPCSVRWLPQYPCRRCPVHAVCV
jgi:hypothetical protein